VTGSQLQREQTDATRFKACIRLKIEIKIGLDFDQLKQSLLNLRLVFFLLIG